MSGCVLRRAERERGAVAIIVAICAVVLFGMAAYALDTGNAWGTRRHLITATDAAALAAAQKYAVGGNGCATEPSAFVTANDVGASVTGCAFTNLGPGAGYVTVNAKKTVDYTFAGLFGINSQDIHSSTTALYGQPLGVTGLRPLGLCQDFGALKAWLDGGMPTPSDPIQISYTKDSPNDCGANAPGNWGVMDFNGGANSNNDTKNWVLNGYPDEVDAPSTIPGDTGAISNSLANGLSYLKTSGITFELPIYATVAGNGANAQFGVVGFVPVVLLDYRVTGPEASRYITLQFEQAVAQGRCCSHGPDTGVRVVAICAVTPTFDSSNCGDR